MQAGNNSAEIELLQFFNLFFFSFVLHSAGVNVIGETTAFL